MSEDTGHDKPWSRRAFLATVAAGVGIKGLSDITSSVDDSAGRTPYKNKRRKLLSYHQPVINDEAMDYSNPQNFTVYALIANLLTDKERSTNDSSAFLGKDFSIEIAKMQLGYMSRARRYKCFLPKGRDQQSPVQELSNLIETLEVSLMLADTKPLQGAVPKPDPFEPAHFTPEEMVSSLIWRRSNEWSGNFLSGNLDLVPVKSVAALLQADGVAYKNAQKLLQELKVISKAVEPEVSCLEFLRSTMDNVPKAPRSR